MKVAILTIHFGHNYGSVLQALALNNYLNEQGYDAKTINYIPKRFGFKEKYFAAKGKPFVIRLLASIIRFPRNFYQYYIFQSFFKKNIKHTIRYNERNIKTISNDFDLFIVGSDQVWNYRYNKDSQNVYYFSFVNNKRKIAYAASFGVDDLPEPHLSTAKKHLSSFDSITVRESTGVNILNKIGIKSYQVIDPVFFKDSDFWCKFAGRISSSHNSYILVYALGAEEGACIDYAYKIAQEHSCSIYLISFRKINDKRINKQFIYASPEGFIRLIRDAKVIVTNSFHGSSFSIILNKEFYVVSRNNFNSRIDSLLDLCDLKWRRLDNSGQSLIPYELIDYSKVNKLLTNQIEDSKNKLKRQILYD